MASVLITGGSRGIGAAAVRAFAARGDQVTFLYEKNHEAAQAVAKETGATALRRHLRPCRRGGSLCRAAGAGCSRQQRWNLPLWPPVPDS